MIHESDRDVRGRRRRVSGTRLRGLFVLVALTGCGRIGYALLDEADGVDGGGKGLDATVKAPHDDASTSAVDASQPADVLGTTDAAEAAEGTGAADAMEADDVIDAGTVMDATTQVDAEAGFPGDALDASADSSSCVTSPIVDYCVGVPSLPAAPVIDGVLDPCGPTLVPITPVGWVGPSPLPPLPAGNSSELAVAWRPDGLYVFMSVTTPAYFPSPTDAGTPIYYGAGVEVFVDSTGVYTDPPAVNDPGGMQLIVTAPPSTTTDGHRADYYRDSVNEGPWTSSQYGTFPTPEGFNFEGFVVAADLGLSTWTPTAGQSIGLDVAVDVSYTSESMMGTQGYRVGQYFFHIAPPPADGGVAIGLPYADPRAWCTPTLAP